MAQWRACCRTSGCPCGGVETWVKGGDVEVAVGGSAGAAHVVTDDVEDGAVVLVPAN